MKYEIRGETLPVVILTMEEGESVFTQSGGMAWMSDGFDNPACAFCRTVHHMPKEGFFMCREDCKT